MAQRIMALEFAGQRVRGAVADRTWNTLELRAVYEHRRESDEPDLSDAVLRLVTEAGKPDVVVSALPGEFVAKRLISLPFSDRRRLDKVVPFALEEHLPFPVDDAVVAFARVGHENSNTLVLAACARKEDLQRHLELLARANLDPKTITLGTFALAGMLARARDGVNAAHLVIDIDHGSTSIVLIGADGTPRAMRTLAALETEDGEPLPQPATSALIGAVRQTLLAHSDQDQTDLILTGASDAAVALREHFEDSFSLPVHDLSEFDCSKLIGGIESQPEQYATCVAMLLGEAPTAPLELLNFRAGEFAFRGRTHALEPYRLSIGLGIAVIVLALAHLVLGISANAEKLHLLNREVAVTVAPALGNTDPAQATMELQGEITRIDKRLRLMGGSLGHGSPLDVLLALSKSIQPGLPVEVNDLQITDSVLKVQGTADSFATVDLVKKALERSSEFGTIKLEHATAGNDASKIDFQLSATLK